MIADEMIPNIQPEIFYFQEGALPASHKLKGLHYHRIVIPDIWNHNPVPRINKHIPRVPMFVKELCEHDFVFAYYFVIGLIDRHFFPIAMEYFRYMHFFADDQKISLYVCRHILGGGARLIPLAYAIMTGHAPKIYIPLVHLREYALEWQKWSEYRPVEKNNFIEFSDVIPPYVLRHGKLPRSYI